MRIERGLTQEQLALEAEVDRTYVSQIERSVGNPSLLVLAKIAGVLERDVQELFETGAMPPDGLRTRTR